MSKRFEVEIGEGFEISLKDNVKNDYPFSMCCEDIDGFEQLLMEVMTCKVRMNDLWDEIQNLEFNERTKKALKRMDKSDTKPISSKRFLKELENW